MGNRQEAGEKLRQAREFRGFSLEEAQNKTKIHIGVLRVLEKGETPRNVNPIYLKGFLKIYATFLGLDPKIVVDGFNLNLPVEDRQVKPKIDEPKKELDFSLSKPKLAAVGKFTGKLIIALIMLVAAILVISALLHRKPKVNIVKHAPANVEPPKVNDIPIEKSSRIKLAIRAKDGAWISVKSDGKTVFQGILRRGLSDTWIAKEKMELALGDAGAVELEINGKRIPPLGRKGEVVKNIKISKDSISVGQPR